MINTKLLVFKKEAIDAAASALSKGNLRVSVRSMFFNNYENKR